MRFYDLWIDGESFFGFWDLISMFFWRGDGFFVLFLWKESDEFWYREVLGYVFLGKGRYLKFYFVYL